MDLDIRLKSKHNSVVSSEEEVAQSVTGESQMKKTMLCIWLSLPVFGFLYHMTAGEAHGRMDQLGSHLRMGRRLAAQELWQPAISQFDHAAELVPSDDSALQTRLRLEKAIAGIEGAGLPDSAAELKKMLTEITANDASPATRSLENPVRESLARSQYYLTWLMRLEGVSEEDWMPEIESARQNYRLLAERAAEDGDRTAEKRQLENLECTIRLQQMSLDDLQGLAIPRPCQSCCSNCRSRRPGPKAGKQPQDARGATAGPPADGAGS